VAGGGSMTDLMTRTPKELAKQARANGQHSRTLIVATAKATMAHAVYGVAEKYQLTDIETLQCVNASGDGVLKYALRVERHGDADYAADAPPVAKRRKAKSPRIEHINGDPRDCRRANLRVRS
jgi:hypothetical protein